MKEITSYALILFGVMLFGCIRYGGCTDTDSNADSGLDSQ